MSGRERMRRCRGLQHAGAYHVNFVLAQDTRLRLVGLLRCASRDDITTAVVDCLARALGMKGGKRDVGNESRCGHHPGVGAGKRETPRPASPPDKAAALLAHLDLLRGAELPGDLVAQEVAGHGR